MAHIPGQPDPVPQQPAQFPTPLSGQPAPQAGGLTVAAQDFVTTAPGAPTGTPTPVPTDITGGQRPTPFTPEALRAAAETFFQGGAAAQGLDPLSLANLGLAQFPGGEEFRRISGELGIPESRGRVQERRQQLISSLLAIPGADERNITAALELPVLQGLETDLQTVDEQLEQARVEVQRGISEIALQPNVTQFQKQRSLQLAQDVGRRSIEQLEAQRRTISGELARKTEQELFKADLPGQTLREQAAALGQAFGLDKDEQAELERILGQELGVAEQEFQAGQRQQLPGLLGQTLGTFGELGARRREFQERETESTILLRERQGQAALSNANTNARRLAAELEAGGLTQEGKEELFEGIAADIEELDIKNTEELLAYYKTVFIGDNQELLLEFSAFRPDLLDAADAAEVKADLEEDREKLGAAQGRGFGREAIAGGFGGIFRDLFPQDDHWENP